jgi:transglutaminase-like putative cysteine protease
VTAYLQSSEVVDADHPAVRERARAISQGCATEVEVARACFEFVRDRIQHSVDFERGPVTCRASDVLAHGTGYCYAKSHLLAALLRANNIPAGFCYQRLSVGEKGPPFCLHGLNAAHLKEFGWYRIDARGNKPGVDAAFTPPVERLAFSVGVDETDLPGVMAEPLPVVVRALMRHTRWDKLLRDLPDVDPTEWSGDGA